MSAAPGPAVAASRFQRRLIAVALGILAVFVIREAGAVSILGRGPFFLVLVGLVAVVVATVSLSLPQPQRCQLCLAVVLTLVVAIPLNKASALSTVELLVVVAACVGLGVIGGLGAKSQLPTEVVAAAVITLGTIGLATALDGSWSGILKLLVSLTPATVAFFLAGRLGLPGRRAVAAVVVGLALAEAALALVEPLLFPDHLWAPAQLNEEGLLVRLPNEILTGMERSQGTMGHPLALSFLLVLATALLLRVLEMRRWAQWSMLALLLAGVLMTGSRNSLLLVVALVLFFPPRRLTAARLFWAALIAAILYLGAVSFGGLSFDFVDEFTASGSYTHRTAAFDAFGQLLTRQDLLQTVVGNGFGGIQRLFAEGLLQTDGFNVVDNQFVAILGQAGVVGLAAFVTLVARPLFIGHWEWRGAALVVVVTCMVFDWLTWPSSAALGFFVIAAASATRRDPNRDDADPPAEPVVRITQAGRLALG